jgi:hypothetical protein
VWTSAAHWLVLLIGLIVISAAGESLFSGVPLSFKLWLVLPVLAVIASGWLLLNAFTVWRRGLLNGGWARLRYTLVALAGLAMAWFYWFWNILGWQYLA